MSGLGTEAVVVFALAFVVFFACIATVTVVYTSYRFLKVTRNNDNYKINETVQPTPAAVEAAKIVPKAESSPQISEPEKAPIFVTKEFERCEPWTEPDMSEDESQSGDLGIEVDDEKSEPEITVNKNIFIEFLAQLKAALNIDKVKPEKKRKHKKQSESQSIEIEEAHDSQSKFDRYKDPFENYEYED